MKVATYNLWHGLNPRGWMAFPYLEPDGRRKRRHEAQVEVLRELKADIIFLQEVSPLYKRMELFETRMGYEAHSCTDNSGVKWLGLGFPLNLSTGLLTLFTPRLAPQLVKTLRLSGAPGEFTGRYFSLQFHESRYALLSEFTDSRHGRVLLVNTHLHHGVHLTPSFRTQLKTFQSTGKLSETALEELLLRLEEGEQRRLSEVGKLLRELEPLKSRYNLMILGGDFNLTEECRGYSELATAGFHDLGRMKGSRLATWDPALNSANSRFLDGFPLAITTDDLSFSDEVRGQLLQLFKAHDRRSRRIDQLWVWTVQGQLELQQEGLFGLPDESGFAPSDHFGYIADWHWRN